MSRGAWIGSGRDLPEQVVQSAAYIACSFETAEVDLLIGELNEQTPDEADQVPEVDRSVPAVSRPGDLWRIGDHVLLCGDALNKDDYVKLLGSKRAQMVLSDPPYNVAIGGNVSGLRQGEAPRICNGLR
ncbi:MAG: hypothetical protein ACM3IH_00360 [Sphingobacteriales bacterium]